MTKPFTRSFLGPMVFDDLIDIGPGEYDLVKKLAGEMDAMMQHHATQVFASGQAVAPPLTAADINSAVNEISAASARRCAVAASLIRKAVADTMNDDLYGHEARIQRAKRVKGERVKPPQLPPKS